MNGWSIGCILFRYEPAGDSEKALDWHSRITDIKKQLKEHLKGDIDDLSTDDIRGIVTEIADKVFLEDEENTNEVSNITKRYDPCGAETTALCGAAGIGCGVTSGVLCLGVGAVCSVISVQCGMAGLLAPGNVLGDGKCAVLYG